MTATDLLSTGGAAIIVSILVQLLKPFIDERWIPLSAIAVGVALVEMAMVAVGLSAGEFVPIDLVNGLLTGILAGASSIGLYQVQKPVGVLGAKGTPPAGQPDQPPPEVHVG